MKKSLPGQGGKGRKGSQAEGRAVQTQRRKGAGVGFP